MLIIVFAGKLVEQRKHSDAATVLEQYAQVNSGLPFHSHPGNTDTPSDYSHLHLSSHENERNCGHLGNPEIVFPLKVFHLAYLTCKSKFSLSLNNCNFCEVE